ncbi:Aspartic proteinase CDR1, partial [Linum perenne]
THASGDLATETLALGHVSFPNTLFGCSHDNVGLFSPKSSGIIGLAEGPPSLITQLGPTIGSKFSYFMVPNIAPNHMATSTMHFGQNAVVSGNDFTGTSFGSPGNIIIDSAVAFTIVPTDFLSELTTAFEALTVGGNKTSDPQEVLSLCYMIDPNLEVPTITMHFKGGDVKLSHVNVLIPMSDTVSCLAFLGNDDVSIYGNSMQQDFVVGYDLVKRTVSFKPADCAMN